MVNATVRSTGYTRNGTNSQLHDPSLSSSIVDITGYDTIAASDKPNNTTAVRDGDLIFIAVCASEGNFNTIGAPDNLVGSNNWSYLGLADGGNGMPKVKIFYKIATLADQGTKKRYTTPLGGTLGTQTPFCIFKKGTFRVPLQFGGPTAASGSGTRYPAIPACPTRDVRSDSTGRAVRVSYVVVNTIGSTTQVDYSPFVTTTLDHSETWEVTGDQGSTYGNSAGPCYVTDYRSTSPATAKVGPKTGSGGTYYDYNPIYDSNGQSYWGWPSDGGTVPGKVMDVDPGVPSNARWKYASISFTVTPAPDPVYPVADRPTVAITDDFSSVSSSTSTFTGTQPTSVNGRLSISATSTWRSVPVGNLKGSTITVEAVDVVPDTATGQGQLICGVNTYNTMYLYTNLYQGKSLLSFGCYANDTFYTFASVNFDPIAMRWWRIREKDGYAYADTSPNGVTWYQQIYGKHTYQDKQLAGMPISLGHGGTRGVGPVLFDNLNILPDPNSVPANAGSATARGYVHRSTKYNTRRQVGTVSKTPGVIKSVFGGRGMALHAVRVDKSVIGVKSVQVDSGQDSGTNNGSTGSGSGTVVDPTLKGDFARLSRLSQLLFGPRADGQRSVVRQIADKFKG